MSLSHLHELELKTASLSTTAAKMAEETLEFKLKSLQVSLLCTPDNMGGPQAPLGA